MNELFEKAKQWALNDPDQNTQAELLSLINNAQSDEASAQELASRFAGFLEFGTAGLRAEIGAGESRMNRLVVRRASAGFCEYLLETSPTQPPVLVVCNDARFLSAEFAKDVCQVATTLGLKVFQLPTNNPTPLLAFSVKQLNASGGVMITASHNPPKDNGYKVYDEFGAGIVPPVDEIISGHILRQPITIETAADESWKQIDTREEYLARLKVVVPKIDNQNLKIAYTPLHGVGRDLFLKALSNLAIKQVFVVDEQADPDPTFKTVAFPNPEEPGATDLLIDLANKVDADLAIAHDPDADRCAIGVKDSNKWRMLKGDELGILLAWWLMQKPQTPKDGVFSASIVSSSLVPKMAEANGFKGEVTLTGMKWAGHIKNLVFGYEEAIGYSVDPNAVSDKDGISAAILTLELTDWAKQQNKSLISILDEIYLQYGLHLTTQVSVRLAHVDLAKEKVKKLISNPPTHLASEEITEVIDMNMGYQQLPPSNGVILKLPDAQIIVRPSGTEPKIKCYLEVIGALLDKTAVEKRLNELTSAMEGYLK
jgi:phosphomannomutase